jgi:hypothetical protein
MPPIKRIGGIKEECMMEAKKINDLRLRECAQYILDHELRDFEEYCLEDDNDPSSHIYAVAYLALYGLYDFESLVHKIKSDAV